MTAQSLFYRGSSTILAAIFLGSLIGCSGPRRRAYDQSPTTSLGTGESAVNAGSSRDLADQSAAATIALTGNAGNSTLTIGDLLSFQITGEGKQTSFKVEPGEHHIRVEKDGVTVVDRAVYVPAGQTLEIPVP